jgi:hypothetical protein
VNEDDSLSELTGLEINQRLQSLINESLDTNHLIMMIERNMAKDALMIRDAFLVQAERMEDISELHGVIARMTADRTGDIISLEMGLEEVTNDDEEEVDGDEDSDD